VWQTEKKRRKSTYRKDFGDNFLSGLHVFAQIGHLKLFSFRFLGAEPRLRGASTSNSAMHHVPVNLGGTGLAATSANGKLGGMRRW